MELSRSKEDAAFRDEVRAFIAEKFRLTRSEQIEYNLSAGQRFGQRDVLRPPSVAPSDDIPSRHRWTVTVLLEPSPCQTLCRQ